MSVWAGDVADLVKPLYQLMIDRVLASHVIGTDDTVMPMLAPEKTRQARMWVYRGDDDHPNNVFDFTLSRSRDGVAQFLKNYDQVLLADAYGGYEGICVEKQIIQAGCWSHARRKVVDAQSLSPAIAAEAVALIGKLFAIEDRAKTSSLRRPSGAAASPEPARDGEVARKASDLEAATPAQAPDGRSHRLCAQPVEAIDRFLI